MSHVWQLGFPFSGGGSNFFFSLFYFFELEARDLFCSTANSIAKVVKDPGTKGQGNQRKTDDELNKVRRQAEYSFGEHGYQTPKSVSFCFPHRAPRRELSEFLSACTCVQKRTHRVLSKLIELAQKLGELSLPTQFSRSIIPPFS